MWKKIGLVYSSNSYKSELRVSSGLTPEPLVCGDVIRVYYSARDSLGRGRIYFAEFDPENSCSILRVSEKPCMDLGHKGEFDDNGHILGSVEHLKAGGIRMYYVGFHLPRGEKFHAFTGAAESVNGRDFERLTDHFVEGKAMRNGSIGAVHTSFVEEGGRRYWYACGDGWQVINHKEFPKYHIKTSYFDQGDGENTEALDFDCILPSGEEYRIGRPKVYRTSKGKYVMYMTFGTIDGLRYEPALAVSDDGIQWTRRDDLLGISLSSQGWDSVHLCYPALAFYKDKVFMFYNGNNMGEDGFGVAEMPLVKWESLFL